MIKKENLDKTSAWPFVEAKKMLRERKSFIEKKGKITLQTGYGPSGLPHIGTFGEVARTSMLVNALNQLSDLPTEIITFSDDMDGLRKVPDNVPNQKLLNDNLHKPLTQVPDPFEKFSSFGEHNNEMLKNFLDSFKFKYNFQSSTSLYKSGFFNPTLKIILDNYEGIMNIIIPTLGKERQQTYSPFLPICPDTGHVLEIPVLEIDKSNGWGERDGMGINITAYSEDQTEGVISIGQYKGGFFNGKGITVWPNGDIYIGQFNKNLRHGKGIYMSKDGSWYNGNWKNAKKNGFGIVRYEDGASYSGQFKNGKFVK